MAQHAIHVLLGQRGELLGFLERRVGNRAIAEDILQEAFARGLDKLETLEREESALAWFYRVLRNAVIDYHRRNAAASRGLESLAREMESVVEPVGETRDAVCKCVGRIAEDFKPEYAHALKRVEVEGIAVKDLADELGISSSNAAVRVFRAREALRKRLTHTCGKCAADGCASCTCGHAD
jgi:RNA polymerase sigma-70 factor (ECF subfamily)